MALGPDQLEVADLVRQRVRQLVTGPMAGIFPEPSGFFFYPFKTLRQDGGLTSFDLYLGVNKSGDLIAGVGYRQNPSRFDERWRFDIYRPPEEEASDEILLDPQYQPAYWLMSRLLRAIFDNSNQSPRGLLFVQEEGFPFLQKLAMVVGDPSLIKNDKTLLDYHPSGGRLTFS